jgi:hypothetical protein
MMELLIVKRMCRVIYVSRLPTGHTHEDIDACFGLIWQAFRHRPCESLQRYKRFIEDALGSSIIKAQVVDVMVVPNYMKFLENCIDEKLSRLHNTVNTQHQWRFEAVEPSKYFPYGVKSTYRAHSSDVVVEFEKMPKGVCVSLIGQTTGLECSTVHVRWYPSPDCDESRPGIEGFYLLRQLPGAEGMKYLEPQEFPEGVTANIQKTLTEVRKKFDFTDDNDIRTDWNNWVVESCPRNDDAVRYVER